MCKISIIMPVFNKVNYIDKAILSVQKQTFPDWELIVIDDGSTDGSSQRCDRYKSDFRIKILHVENGGVSRARNIGFKIAQGEYITFIDADDYIDTRYLENLYTSGQDMIISGLTKVNHQGKIIEKVVPCLYKECSIDLVSRSFYEEQKKSGIYGFVASKLIKRKIIEENNIRFDEQIKLAEDYDFFLKIYSLVEKIYFKNNADYYYVQETENSSVDLDDRKIDFFIQAEIQIKTKQFLKSKMAYGQQEEKIFLNSVTGYLYTILILGTYNNYREFLEVYYKLKSLIPEVQKHIQGFQRICIELYDRNAACLLYLILKIRMLVRK